MCFEDVLGEKSHQQSYSVVYSASYNKYCPGKVCPFMKLLHAHMGVTNSFLIDIKIRYEKGNL